MKNLVFVALLGASLFTSVNAAVITHGFTGAFSPSKFTANPNGGSIDLTNAPHSISLTSSDDRTPTLVSPPTWWEVYWADYNTDSADLSIRVDRAYTLNFDFSFVTSNVYGVMGPTYYDPFGLMVNGQFYQLTIPHPDAPYDRSGNVSVFLKAGDVFTFSAKSLDSGGGAATTTISNFSASEVPEPASIFLATAGLLGLALARRRNS